LTSLEQVGFWLETGWILVRNWLDFS